MTNEPLSIAVFSDIHSNHIALEACLEYVLKRGITTFIFLGDYLADMANPQKTMQLLYQLKDKYTCYFIRGNKEDYWLNYKYNRKETWSKGSTGSLLYNFERLMEKDFAFFKELPIARTLSFPHLPSITICHGSPYSTTEGIRTDNERTFEIMDNNDTSVILCGHTHIQKVITYNQKTVLNGGSVGAAYNSNGLSQFMLLHGKDGAWTHEFISLEYDNEKVIEELMLSELMEYAPHWSIITANVVRKGTPSHGAVLTEAMRLCEEETGHSSWNDIPDKYWNLAIGKLIHL